jgi:hypothetical protein
MMVDQFDPALEPACSVLRIRCVARGPPPAPRRAEPDRETRELDSEAAFGSDSSPRRVASLARPLARRPGGNDVEMSLRWLIDGIARNITN